MLKAAFLFLVFAISPPGKIRLKRWRELRRQCLEMVKQRLTRAEQ